MSRAQTPLGGLSVRKSLSNDNRQFMVENAVSYDDQPCADPRELPSWDDFYVGFGGYFGGYGPHVFAAAPELLDALKAICDEQDANEGYATPATYDAARAAISRATGEAA